MTWFVHSDDDGFREYETEQEALDAAVRLIEGHNDGEWSDGVESIIVGQITHRAQQCNVVTKEMLVDGEYNGRFYGGGYDYWCDYQMEREGYSEERVAAESRESKLANDNEILRRACQEALRLMPYAHRNACAVDPRCDNGEILDKLVSSYSLCEDRLRDALEKTE